MGFNNNTGRWTPDAPQQTFGGAGVQGYGGNTSGIGYQTRQNYGGAGPMAQQMPQQNQYIQQGGQAPLGMISETNPQVSSIAQIIQNLFGGGGGMGGQQPMGAGLGGSMGQQQPIAQAIQQMFQPTISQQDYNAIPWQSQDMYYGEM
jgi:hypothetical protein